MTPITFRLRRVASAAGLIAVVLPGIMIAKAIRFRTSSLSDNYVVAALLFGLVIVSVTSACVIQLRRKEPSRGLAVALAIAGISSALILPQRLVLGARSGEEGWPLSGWVDRWKFSPPDERIAFALRVAASESEDYRLKNGRFPSNASELSAGSLPSVARDVAVRLVTVGDTMPRVIGSLSGRICVLRLMPASERTRWDPDIADPDCIDGSDASGTTARAAGSQATAAAPTDDGVSPKARAESWLQYRGGEGREGTVGEPPVAARSAGWQAHLWGEGRSTPSVVGNVVLVGAHGSGALDARDRVSGRLIWRAREPNWIHQDVVSDGRIVIVGFGDNQPSKYRLAPSGVSARDLRTGVLLWRRFTHGSEMTSPVIVSGLVVGGSSDGEIFAIDLASGKPRWDGTVAGGIVMAPPAASGDTVYFSADPSTICAVLAGDGRKLWCSNVTNTFKLGHSAVTIEGGRLFVTSTRPVGILEQFFQRNFEPTALAQVWLNLDPTFFGQATNASALDVYQELISISTASGEVQWRTRLGSGGMPEGHTSGTASAIVGSSDVLVLSPAAHAVFRINSIDGRVVWQSVIGGRARGPVLAIGNHVIVLRADASLQVIDIETGAHSCRMALPRGVDRAGPTLSGELAIFADVQGAVYAVDATQLARCNVNFASLPDPARATPPQ